MIAGRVLVGICVAAGLVTALVAWFVYAIHCTSGDGGAPYVAPDSARADACEVTSDGGLLALVSFGAVGFAGFFAWRAAGRWAVAGGAVRLAGLVLLAAVSPLLLSWIASAPSSECSEDKEAANAAWEEAGQKGPRPYDCEAY